MLTKPKKNSSLTRHTISNVKGSSSDWRKLRALGSTRRNRAPEMVSHRQIEFTFIILISLKSTHKENARTR